MLTLCRMSHRISVFFQQNPPFRCQKTQFGKLNDFRWECNSFGYTTIFPVNLLVDLKCFSTSKSAILEGNGFWNLHRFWVRRVSKRNLHTFSRQRRLTNSSLIHSACSLANWEVDFPFHAPDPTRCVLSSSSSARWLRSALLVSRRRTSSATDASKPR